MPEMNGLEMMLELTRSFPNVKVIAMSGGPESEGGLQRGQAVGCASDVSKALRYGEHYSVPFDTNWRISGQG